MAYTLDYYKRQLRAKNTEIANRKAKNKKIKQEVDRLQRAYDKLMAVKRRNTPDAEFIKQQVKVDKLAPNVKWRGKYKNDFDNLVKNDAKDAAKEFFDSIDKMLDQVSKELYKKKGSYDTGIAALNALNRGKNWLEGVIRNWVN